jgi:hypothetical protein
VKTLRIWLVVLLTVLVPVRGVLAAVMPCAPEGTGSRIGSHAEAPAFQTGHLDQRHAEQAADPAADSACDPGLSSHHGHGASGQDKCDACSASCGGSPLPSAAAGVDEPIALSSVSFPGISARAPSFLSDGQERPPRTC